MSAEANIAKLEGLLGQIGSRRRPRPVGLLSRLREQHADAASPESDEPELVIDDTEVLLQDAETPTVVATKAPSAATPMETALAGGIDDDEPELEIVIDDDDDDEPEIVIEEPDAPTAPLGTRAPKPARPAPKPAAHARPKPQPAATPAKPAPTAQPVALAGPAPVQPSPGGPARLALAEPPAAEVAQVVSQPTEISFGDLLDRTLALRPR